MIAFDLVATSPMSSMYGNIAYVEYVKGTTKGQSKAGDMTNSVYQLGDVDENYTGEAVVETVATAGKVEPAFGPIVKGAFTNPKDNKQYDAKLIADVSGDVTYVNVETDGKINAVKGRMAYKYNNVQIPQETLPTLKAELKNIGLVAKARRISVYYSQIAQFQAKTDYGFDLADGLAEQAVGQLSYEIDTEIVNMLKEAAPTATGITNFSKTLPSGVSMADHYASFAAKLEEYKMAIYSVTKKFTPTFLVVAPNVMPIVNFVPGFSPAGVSNLNGPYLAGTLNGLKVFVTPNIAEGEFFLGVNNGAMQASCGIFAPYMPVVPTQLLGFADGGQTQGWSTMYDCKILNASLLLQGKIVA